MQINHDEFAARLNGLKARLDILAMLAVNAGVDCLKEHSLSSELIRLADEADALHECLSSGAMLRAVRG